MAEPCSVDTVRHPADASLGLTRHEGEGDFVNLVVIIYLWLLSVSFFVGLAISVVALYAAWGMGPKLQRSNVLCCLVIVFVTFFWVVMLSQLFDPVLEAGPNALDWFVYAALLGATPLAAFPGIWLYGGSTARKM